MKTILHTTQDGFRTFKISYNWERPSLEAAFIGLNINNITDKDKWLQENGLPLAGFYWESSDECSGEGPFVSERGAGMNYVLVTGKSKDWDILFRVKQK